MLLSLVTSASIKTTNKMIFHKEDTTTIITPEKASLSALPEALKKVYPQYKQGAIIVNLLHFDTLTEAEILPFLELSNTHRASGQSFVLVNAKVAYEAIPEEIAVVPTLQEAKDLIAMEDIERDLGM